MTDVRFDIRNLSVPFPVFDPGRYQGLRLGADDAIWFPRNAIWTPRRLQDGIRLEFDGWALEIYCGG